MQLPGVINELVTQDPLRHIFPSPHVVPKYNFSIKYLEI